MRLNHFGVYISGGHEIKEGYVEMKHGVNYTLTLRNERAVRADAQVFIDGKEVGTWRIDGHSSITIERPVDDTGRFTFYKLGTSEAQQAELQDNESLGLISVTFMPEKAVKPLKAVKKGWDRNQTWSNGPNGWNQTWSKYPVRDFNSDPIWSNSSDNKERQFYYNNTSSDDIVASASIGSYSAGGTGLSGQSDQMFYTVAPLNYDLSQQTVIHLRLVARQDIQVSRPLASAVPPRI